MGDRYEILYVEPDGKEGARPNGYAERVSEQIRLMIEAVKRDISERTERAVFDVPNDRVDGPAGDRGSG